MVDVGGLVGCWVGVFWVLGICFCVLLFSWGVLGLAWFWGCVFCVVSCFGPFLGGYVWVCGIVGPLGFDVLCYGRVRRVLGFVVILDSRLVYSFFLVLMSSLGLGGGWSIGSVGSNCPEWSGVGKGESQNKRPSRVSAAKRRGGRGGRPCGGFSTQTEKFRGGARM